MKKILLGTTTLVGAALVAQAALADAPKVTVGGFSEFQAGIMSDDQDINRRNHAFRSDNEISFKVDGKSDAGLGYGAEIWLEADVDADNTSSVVGSDADDQGVNASKTFLYVEGAWGRFEGGSNLGADQTLKIDAASIARATGGIDGDWTYFANNTSNNPFIATPDLPLNYGFTGPNGLGLGDESQKNLNKITYYTPKWSGFQAGISYIPSDQERGQFTNSTTRFDAGAGTLGATTTFGSGANSLTLSEADSIWVGGVNWSGQWDQVAIGLAATAEHGDAELTTHEDLFAWQVGGKVSFMGFSLAASYADWDDSLRLKTNSNDDSSFWTLGGAYENGPWGISVTYLTSDLSDDGAGVGVGEHDFDNLVIGADYKLAPGFTPYVEVSFYDQDAVGVTSANNNDGHVFLLGSQLNF